MESDRARISTFVDSLGLALYDKALELKGHQVVFFLDADIVLKLVLGIEGLPPESPNATSRMEIVRSLFSIGYMGSFYLLRPHAFEFYMNLKTKPKYQNIDSREAFRERALSYIEKTGIRETMGKLARIIGDERNLSKAEEDKKIMEFLGTLSENSGESFSYIERINGTWSDRFNRFFNKKLLKLDYLGPEISELVIDQKDVLFKINTIVKEKREMFTLNAFQDAAALTIIHKFISEKESGTIDFYSRFYTDTTPLNDVLMNNPEIKEILSYKTNEIHERFNDSYKGIHRDTNYFIIRAVIKELKPSATDVSIEKLDRLYEIYDKLKGLLEDNKDIERASKAVEKDVTLSSLLDDFEKTSIMEPLWHKKDGLINLFPKIEDVSEWIKIFHFAQGTRTGEILHAQMNERWKELEVHVSKLSTWTNDFKAIIKAQGDRVQYFEKIEEPMRDLGLIRWNYNISNINPSDILDMLRDFTVKGQQVEIPASILANNMGLARKNIKECNFVCAILWGLGLFKEIDIIVEECRLQNIGTKFPVNLSTIQFAAIMRHGRISTPDDRRKMLRNVARFMSGLSKKERKGTLLGVGYIYYHAWRQVMLKANIKERLWDNQPEETRKWAQEAFNLGEEGYLDAFEPNTLPWAYAINHCAYLHITTGVPYDKSQRDYLQILLKLKIYGNLWCARFDDTVGCYYLDRAERLWHLSNDEEKKTIDISKHIIEADIYFSSALKHDTGDTDLPEHITRLELLRDSFEDFKKTTASAG